MQTWYVTFADRPQTPVVHQQWDRWPGNISDFRQACQAGVIDGRYVLGMWIVDRSEASTEILERFGSVPPLTICE
jgi:hypothetical protein